MMTNASERAAQREQFVRDKVVELFRVMNAHQSHWGDTDHYSYEDIASIPPQVQAYRALVEHLFPEQS